jgi:tRNA (cmo5U34)-methyltransferase
MQQKLLELLPFAEDQGFLLVDAGGGSGRLAALVLDRYPYARAVVVDQSEAFLELARARLAAFGDRGVTLLARLQDDWLEQLPDPPDAIVSMSAIHHLAPPEKQSLYGRMRAALAPGGVLMNGDEIRPPSDADYLRELEAWSDHMRRKQDSGEIPPPMGAILDIWRDKNIAHFGEPKQSGDDCHEPVATQLDYLRAAGFAEVDAPWQRQMWAILRGRL